MSLIADKQTDDVMNPHGLMIPCLVIMRGVRRQVQQTCVKFSLSPTVNNHIKWMGSLAKSTFHAQHLILKTNILT